MRCLSILLITVLNIVFGIPSYATQLNTAAPNGHQASPSDTKNEKISPGLTPDISVNEIITSIKPIEFDESQCSKEKKPPEQRRRIVTRGKSIVAAITTNQPDVISVRFRSSTINQPKKDLPLASRELMILLAEKVQEKLESDISADEKQKLVSSLQDEFRKLERTGEFDPNTYPAFAQILAETLITNVNAFLIGKGAEWIPYFIPILKEVSLFNVTLDLKASLATFSGGLNLSYGTKEALALGTTQVCKMHPFIKSQLAIKENEYTKSRREVLQEAPSGLSKHGAIYNTIDKAIIPLVLPLACKALTEVVTPYLCGYTGLDQQEASFIVGTTTFFGATLIQAGAQYFTQRGGTLVNAPRIATRVMEFSIGAFKFTRNALNAVVESTKN